MIKYRLIFILVNVTSIIFQCKSEDDNIPYKNSLIKPIILGYIKSFDRTNEFKDIFTVVLESKKDTLVFTIANSYPVLDEARYNGLKVINGQRVAFVGKKIDNFYDTADNIEIPEDIKTANLSPLDSGHKRFYIDYRDWVFYFKNERLVRYYPKSEIDRFVDTGQATQP